MWNRVNILGFFAFFSCSVGPQYVAPETPVTTGWKNELPHLADEQCPKNWWQIFHDEQLSVFIEQAICSNPSLQAMAERVQQGRSFAKVAYSRLFPQLNIDPSISNTELRTHSFGSTSQIQPTLIKNHIDEYNLPLTLVYELDFWGKWKNQYKSAQFKWESDQYRYQTAVLLLTTDLANAYFQLRIQDAKIEIYKDVLMVQKKILGIQDSRYETQLINFSNVAQSSSDYSMIESLYFDCFRKRSLFENQIAVLIGVSPSEFKLASTPLTLNPPMIPVDLPANVLLRRPDLAEQERMMASLHAEINVAYASFFPSADIVGGINFLSNNFIQTLKNQWFIGGNLLEVLIDAGERSANIDLKTAVYKEALFTYQQKVLGAFQEVEDSISSIKWVMNELTSVDRAISAKEIAYKIAMDRYQYGLDNFLNVAVDEKEKLDQKLSWLHLLSQQYIYTLHLIKAMGGGW